MRFPFCHWPLKDEARGCSVTCCVVVDCGCMDDCDGNVTPWWCVVVDCDCEDDCDGTVTPGGRGKGWALISGHSMKLWCDWNTVLFGLLGVSRGLETVGLRLGDRSGLCMVFAGDTFGAKPRLSWNSWKAAEEGKRSPEFNLRGLAAGLEKTLFGALLAGALSLEL